MDTHQEFADVLCWAMQRPQRVYTAGLLSKLSRVPKMTILNWLHGRVSQPRNWRELARVADALHLSKTEASHLLQSAGFPPLEELLSIFIDPPDQVLLSRWVERAQYPLQYALDTPTLPTTTLPLFGRENEIAILRKHLIQCNAQTVVVSGPVGVGKTRLALHCATQFQDLFPGGITWMSFAGDTNPTQMLSNFLQTCTAQNRAAFAPPDTCIAAPRSILILDEYEHTNMAAIQALIAEIPHLTVLITSRISTHGAYGSEIRLAPLPLPDTNPSLSIAQLATQPAMALFIARAQMVQSDFRLTAANAGAVAALCFHLDGLPLAIELAAARVKVASPQELLAYLHCQSYGRLRLLVGGAHDAPSHQRSMREAIGWSYARLPEEARLLFLRLALFEHGCSLAAAAAVQPNTRAGVHHALHLLDTLCAHHLLRISRQAGDVCYVMFETIREFALEQRVIQPRFGPDIEPVFRASETNSRPASSIPAPAEIML